MRKILMSVSMILLVFLMSGCNKVKQNGEAITPTVAPTAQPTVTLPAEDSPEDKQEDVTGEKLTISDYYPLIADTEYVYEGNGNEYASYNRVTDFIDTANNRIQTRTNNGGSETVRVIEIKDGKLSVIKMVNECYYRENFMADAAAGDDAEVLLMEPLVQGTEWTLPDGSRRYISATDAIVDTPLGSYQALEVTTESNDGITKDYYAPQAGLVKSIFEYEDMAVSSTIIIINADTPFTKTIDIFYPDVDEKIYMEPLTLEFRTNDETKQVLQEAISRKAEKESYLPLASVNTKINSLYLGKDNIVHVDFSAELAADMNTGAGYEAMILQSITNTLGNYYGVQEVVITMDGKPYESGHILMREGEAFKVNMDNVVY